MIIPAYFRIVAHMISLGKVVLLPVDTVMGLSSCLDGKAIDRVRMIKKRNQDMKFIILVNSFAMARSLTEEWTPFQEDFLHKHWPSSLTVILNKKNSLFKDTVALRYPDFFPLNMLLFFLKLPIISTSANISGDLTPTIFGEVSESILSQVDMSLNHYEPLYKAPSTIVSLVNDIVEVVRPSPLFHFEGAVS